MSIARTTFALAAVVLTCGLAVPAAAQFACTTPNDPACNHLKCYQIKDPPITVNVQVDNQFDREAFIQLTPVLLCTPAKKSCCTATGGCSPNNCPPNPVPAPGLPHFKCYRFKGKTACTDLACTSTVKFPRGTVVNLTDQFGVETNVPVGKPVIFCTPALKEVVSPTTTTTTTPPPTTTTTTLCVPPNCPTTTTTSSSTTTTTTPPPCRQMPGPTGPVCGGFCPTPMACVNVAGPSGFTCNCGQPCGLNSAMQCAGFCPGPGQQCQPTALSPCTCCGLPNTPCMSAADCCSGTCNAATSTCG